MTALQKKKKKTCFPFFFLFSERLQPQVITNRNMQHACILLYNITYIKYVGTHLLQEPLDITNIKLSKNYSKLES